MTRRYETPELTAYRQQRLAQVPLPPLVGNTRKGAAERIRLAVVESCLGLLVHESPRSGRTFPGAEHERAESFGLFCLRGFVGQQTDADYWRRPDEDACRMEFLRFRAHAIEVLGLCRRCLATEATAERLCAACVRAVQAEEEAARLRAEEQERRRKEREEYDAKAALGICGVFREEQGVFYWDSTYETCDCERMWCRGCTTAVRSYKLPVGRVNCPSCGGQGTVVPAWGRIPEPRMKRRMEGGEYREFWLQKCEACGAPLRDDGDAHLGPLAGLASRAP